MSEKEALLELLDYDLWANEQWLEPAQYAGLTLVLGHVVWAQETWLARCKGEGNRVVEDVHPDKDHLHRTIEAWKQFLSETPLDTEVAYFTLSGVPFSNQVHSIVRHVLNHGTYHRGDMRGRCELLGKPFPETDYIGFLRHRAAQP